VDKESPDYANGFQKGTILLKGEVQSERKREKHLELKESEVARCGICKSG